MQLVPPLASRRQPLPSERPWARGNWSRLWLQQPRFLRTLCLASALPQDLSPVIARHNINHTSVFLASPPILPIICAPGTQSDLGDSVWYEVLFLIFSLQPGDRNHTQPLISTARSIILNLHVQDDRPTSDMSPSKNVHPSPLCLLPPRELSKVASPRSLVFFNWSSHAA